MNEKEKLMMATVAVGLIFVCGLALTTVYCVNRVTDSVSEEDVYFSHGVERLDKFGGIIYLIDGTSMSVNAGDDVSFDGSALKITKYGGGYNYIPKSSIVYLRT